MSLGYFTTKKENIINAPINAVCSYDKNVCKKIIADCCLILIDKKGWEPLA